MTEQDQEFKFEPKRILKHKDHVTINEGDKYDADVQHLQRKQGEFVELKKNEAARKYGSKKLVRDLDFKNRDGLKVEETGLGGTPDWFEDVAGFIDWNHDQTLLYELDYLWLNMFFVRELYGGKGEGREQILELTHTENGVGLRVMAQLDYNADDNNSDYDKDEVDGFIEVDLVEEEKERDGKEGREFDIDVDYKQRVFSEDSGDLEVANALREILTGICLKHDHRGEQLHFKVTENDIDGVYSFKILNKDFTVRFHKEEGLGTGVSPWVLELLALDGAPIDTEATEVTK